METFTINCRVPRIYDPFNSNLDLNRRKFRMGTADVGRDVCLRFFMPRPALKLFFRLTLPDLTPNSGLWWYFFTEMFDHFRPFFLMVFSVHLIIYVIPVCLKFQYVSCSFTTVNQSEFFCPRRYDPLYALFIVLGILGTFKSYTTLSDPGLFLSMFAIFPETYQCEPQFIIA